MRDETRDVWVKPSGYQCLDATRLTMMKSEYRDACEHYVPHAQLVELERQLAEVTAERDELRKGLP